MSKIELMIARLKSNDKNLEQQIEISTRLAKGADISQSYIDATHIELMEKAGGEK